MILEYGSRLEGGGGSSISSRSLLGVPEATFGALVDGTGDVGIVSSHAWTGMGIKRGRGDGEERMSMRGMEISMMGILKTKNEGLEMEVMSGNGHGGC